MGENSNHKVRELKRMISSVNYEGSNSAGRKNRASGREDSRSRDLSIIGDDHEDVYYNTEC